MMLACLFSLLPLWNIPHTIVARYLFAVLLLLPVIAANPDWKRFFQNNKILLVFFSYLGLQLIFFSSNFIVAFENFKAEWMKMILFTLLGAGVGLSIVKGHSRTLMLYLGIAFCIPLLIHLGLSLLEGMKGGAVPWGYWGINKIHGDLGYTAIPATIFLSVFLLFQAKSNYEKVIALFLLSACVVSPLIAGSRGGVVFVLIVMASIYAFSVLLKPKYSSTRKRHLWGAVALLVSIVVVTKVGPESDPVRWTGVMSRLELGLKGDPLQVNCEGVSVLENILKQEGKAITPELSRRLASIEDGDGARVMTARAALMLSAANPMGIDQSKSAYQIALSRICNPKIHLAHAHNGWIDTALAIGIPGAVLYLLVLLNFARLSIRPIQHDATNRPYAIALFATSTIWIARAFVDSAQRDQMLEMQVFTIAFLYGYIVSNKGSDPISSTAISSSLGKQAVV